MTGPEPGQTLMEVAELYETHADIRLPWSRVRKHDLAMRDFLVRCAVNRSLILSGLDALSD